MIAKIIDCGLDVQNPQRLAAGSKPAMSQALNSTAQLVNSDDEATAYEITWHTTRFQHVQKIRQ